MPERLAPKKEPKPAIPPAPTVQINLGIGIGGLNRSMAVRGSNNSRDSWEEDPGTDWSKMAREQQVYRGPKRSISAASSSSRRPLDLPRIWFGEDGIYEDVTKGHLLVFLRFSGDINLLDPRNEKRKAYFRPGQRYYKIPGSTSTVYATLDWGPAYMRVATLMIGTIEDDIHCQVTSSSLPRILQGFNLVEEPRECRIAELTDAYDRQRMAISVLDPKLLKVRYNRLHI